MKKYILITDLDNSLDQIEFTAQMITCTQDYEERDNYFQPLIEYTPTKGDCLYLDSEVNIPRVKFKDLVNKGVKNVRHIDAATHIVISNNSGANNFNNIWYYSVTAEIVKEIIVDFGDNPCNYNLDEIKLLEGFLINYTETDILLDYNSIRKLRNAEFSILKKLYYKYKNQIELSSQRYYVLNNSKLSEHFQSKTLINENAILSIINGVDCVTIDHEMYIQLKSMFNSRDIENHILAMEIMSNCNYLSSLLYLEMLFKDFSYVMSESRTKNHVNFKSLTTYLEKSKNYFNTDLNDVVKSLIKRNVLTVDALNILMDEYSDEIQSEGDNDYFKVKTITVNKELLEQLNTNYTYTVEPDYEVKEVILPEVVEPEILEEQEETVSEIEDVIEEQEIEPEEIAIAFERIEREELKEELEQHDVQEQVITNTTNNESDDFEWF
jgi:hypothetical protein